MDREVVLAVLVLMLCGPILLGLGLFRVGGPGDGPAVAVERGAWNRLCLPALPGLLVLALLIGWAVQEPDRADESVLPHAILFASPFACVWLRAALRAMTALFQRRPEAAAATIGLLRPRILISTALRSKLDSRALRAVEEHEAAHLRHRGPLRIWLGQIVADLQWPCSSAPRRYRDWRRALELRRDEEACARGVEGVDLAAALVEAARCGEGNATVAASAALLDAGALLHERVMRLLAFPAGGDDAIGQVARSTLILVGFGVLLSIGMGVFFGDALIRKLPGVAF